MEAEPLFGTQIVNLVGKTREKAFSAKGLFPMVTTFHFIEEYGIRVSTGRVFCLLISIIKFVVQQITHSKKSEAKKVSVDGVDVFMPYDSALYVCDASPEHVLLLNKYPQYPDSLVIPTKALVPQESNLTETDIQALWHVVSGIDGFGFFNCGRDAGYSQEHKHMQALPLPQTAFGEYCIGVVVVCLTFFCCRLPVDAVVRQAMKPYGEVSFSFIVL